MFRHNEIRGLTANLLTEVCSQVCVEPELQPVHSSSNIQEGARLDIAANGFWREMFYGCQVFNPLAPSNCSLSSTYKKHENIKYSWNWACLFYCHCLVCYWGIGSWSHKLLASLLSTMSIPLSWVGFVAVLAFLCFPLLYSASEVHILPLEFILGLLLQWIWCQWSPACYNKSLAFFFLMASV